MRILSERTACSRLPARGGLLHAGRLAYIDRLRVDAANLRCLGDTGDGQHVGSQTHIAVGLLGSGGDGGEGAVHNHFEPLRDLFDPPEEALEVLHPLEVADGDAARVGQDVRNDHDILLEKDFIGCRSCGAVGGFRDDARLNAVGVFLGDDAFGGGRNQDVAGNFQHILDADSLGVGEADDGAALLLVAQHGSGIKPALVVDAAARIADGDDFAALVVEEARRYGAGIAKALDTDARALQGHANTFRRLARDEENAGRGRVVAPLAATDGERLAGDNGGDRVALVHGVGVHDPGHYLGIGVDIGGRNIAMRADNNGDFGRVTTGQAFQFSRAHLLGVADDATFRAAIGNADDGTLPRHPHRQRLDLVQRHLRAVANAALGRATIDVVLDAIAGKGVDTPIVKTNREMNDQFAFGLAENLAHILGEVQAVSRQFELLNRHLIGVDRTHIIVHIDAISFFIEVQRIPTT